MFFIDLITLIFDTTIGWLLGSVSDLVIGLVLPE